MLNTEEMRQPAYNRVKLFKEFLELSDMDRGYENIPSQEEREKYEKLSKELSSAIYWMQLRLTNAEEWLKEEEAIKDGARNQYVIDRLRNIRDALTYNQGRWHGEDNS
jgi:hypothetical protein